MTVDLTPAARRVARLVEGTPDDALGRPTPCADYTVADLLDRIVGLAGRDPGWQPTDTRGPR